MDSWKWEVKMRIAALQEVIQLLVSRFAGLLDLHGGSSSATATHRGLNTLAAMLLHSGRCYHHETTTYVAMVASAAGCAMHLARPLE